MYLTRPYLTFQKWENIRRNPGIFVYPAVGKPSKGKGIGHAKETSLCQIQPASYLSSLAQSVSVILI